MTQIIEKMAEEIETQKAIIDELLEFMFRLQARVSAISEILIKEDITDPAELQALEKDNLNTIEYSISRE